MSNSDEQLLVKYYLNKSIKYSVLNTFCESYVKLELKLKGVGPFASNPFIRLKNQHLSI